MEKRKVYKISIIDREISRTEFDRNTFYTSDSELTLVFKLIERDYTYDHGEILLYNENDKSFVTRQIEKQENDFVYEIDSDIIQHYGKWKAQLQLVNDGDVYTSKPFEFSIVNDLSNLAPQPTLTDINNWSTLKKNAAELIDEMRTVIDDIKKAESQHETAEMTRQSQENSRVQSESERQNQEILRSQGESQRQSKENKRVESENERRLNEIDRESSENNRQTIFENNEVRRKETFNNNEATRQEKETARQQAETQRVSAESSRVSAEAQREIDHANRSAELDGKADKVYLENLIENGDFNQGGLKWTGFGEIQGDLLISQNYRIYQNVTDKNIDNNDIVFISTFLKNDLNSPNDETLVLLGVTGNLFTVGTATKSKINLFSRVFVKGLNNIVIVSVGMNDRFNLDINKGVTLINLTKTFGAGNEPTKEEMDELIKITGYINNEYALNNKEMLIWTLALIRRNRNAVIALGGTI